MTSLATLRLAPAGVKRAPAVAGEAYRELIPAAPTGGGPRSRPAGGRNRGGGAAGCRGGGGERRVAGGAGAPPPKKSRSRPRRRGSPEFVALRKIKDDDRPGEAGGA